MSITKRPTRIVGNSIITISKVFVALPILLFGYSAAYMPVRTATGRPIREARNVRMNVPTIAGPMPPSPSPGGARVPVIKPQPPLSRTGSPSAIMLNSMWNRGMTVATVNTAIVSRNSFSLISLTFRLPAISVPPKY